MFEPNIQKVYEVSLHEMQVPVFFLARFSEMVCYYFFLGVEREWLAQSHFMTKVVLQLMISSFLALCLYYYSKLASSHWWWMLSFGFLRGSRSWMGPTWPIDFTSVVPELYDICMTLTSEGIQVVSNQCNATLLVKIRN